MKPLPIDKLTLELISPKRDIAQLSVNQGSKKSRVRAVIEYRGDALILARTYGDCDIEQVAETLTLIYLKRYGRKAFGEIIGRRKEGKVCDTTLEDPHHFSKFLHLIHTLGELEDPLPRPAGEG